MTAFWRMICAEVVALTAILVLVVSFRTWRRLTGSRAPTENRLLRPPGESLNRKLAELNEKLNLTAGLLIGGPVLLALTTQTLPTTTFLPLLLAVTGLCSVPMWIVATIRRNYALGYLGERAVGEELNQLLRDGCHVFHDYPGGPNWNIDHVIVAPSGVYAVETKARSKRRAPKGRRDYEVIFDGKMLKFPNGNDADALEQARRNAKGLSRELSSSTGEPVKVTPILTIPGWFVTLQGKGDVHVLNPKQIRSVILAGSENQLPPAQIQRIVHQLDQKCRDVEF